MGSRYRGWEFPYGGTLLLFTIEYTHVKINDTAVNLFYCCCFVSQICVPGMARLTLEIPKNYHFHQRFISESQLKVARPFEMTRRKPTPVQWNPRTNLTASHRNSSLPDNIIMADHIHPLKLQFIQQCIALFFLFGFKTIFLKYWSKCKNVIVVIL